MKTLNRRDFGVDLGLALAASILLPATSARADDMEIHIDNFVFQPPELTIKVGTTVTWTNRDDIPHTVVSAGKFRSKTLDTDDKFTFTFTNVTPVKSGAEDGAVVGVMAFPGARV